MFLTNFFIPFYTFLAMKNKVLFNLAVHSTSSILLNFEHKTYIFLLLILPNCGRVCKEKYKIVKKLKHEELLTRFSCWLCLKIWKMSQPAFPTQVVQNGGGIKIVLFVIHIFFLHILLFLSQFIVFLLKGIIYCNFRFQWVMFSMVQRHMRSIESKIINYKIYSIITKLSLIFLCILFLTIILFYQG